MPGYLHTLTSILILAIIILLVVWLRQRGLLKEENGILFSKLVTHVTLPALILDALARSTLEWQYVLLFIYMFLTELLLLAIAWVIGKMMKLPAAQMGTFLLVSAFGSSALLGYALIVELYPHNIAALTEGAFVSELGVGLPLFTIGVMIMMYYGKKEENGNSAYPAGLQFFRSPIFIAIVLGLLWSFSSLGSKGMLITPFFEATHRVAKANTFLVALTVGVLLSFTSLRQIAGIAFATVVIKLLLSPMLVYIQASMLTLEAWQLQVLLLEAAMPSAMLSVVLAKQYGCDAKLAAQMVFITLFVSLFSVSLMINL